MLVLRLFQRRQKPVLLRHIHICLDTGRRSGLHQAPILRKQGDIVHIVLIAVIQEHQLVIDRLRSQIRILHRAVIQRIRQLHHGPKIRLHRPRRLSDQALVLLPHHLQHLVG